MKKGMLRAHIRYRHAAVEVAFPEGADKETAEMAMRGAAWSLARCVFGIRHPVKVSIRMRLERPAPYYLPRITTAVSEEYSDKSRGEDIDYAPLMSDIGPSFYRETIDVEITQDLRTPVANQSEQS